MKTDKALNISTTSSKIWHSSSLGEETGSSKNRLTMNFRNWPKTYWLATCILVLVLVKKMEYSIKKKADIRSDNL